MRCCLRPVKHKPKELTEGQFDMNVTDDLAVRVRQYLYWAVPFLGTNGYFQFDRHLRR